MLTETSANATVSQRSNNVGHVSLVQLMQTFKKLVSGQFKVNFPL